MNSKNLVIIPTFNEVENILIIIDKVLNLPIKFDILVVDDNSPEEPLGLCLSHKKIVKELILKLRMKKRV